MCVCVCAAHRHVTVVLSRESLCDGCTFARESRLEAMRHVDLSYSMRKSCAVVMKKSNDKQERVHPLQACAIERRCSHNRQTRGLKRLVDEALSY